ncbi:hypothetical protein ACOMHN_036051 [Nucella lapillus]
MLKKLNSRSMITGNGLRPFNIEELKQDYRADGVDNVASRLELRRQKQKEYNRRYWLKIKCDPLHYQKRKQANMENNRRFRNKKKLHETCFTDWSHEPQS